MRMEVQRYRGLAGLMAGLVLAATLVGCGSSTPPPPISVSVTASVAQLGQGQTVNIIATVTNDPAGQGVTWTLTGPGALTKQSATSVEYDAPARVASDGSAMINAASVADATKFASVNLQVKVITVTVTPSPLNVLANGSQLFTAAVQFDGSNAGVTWSISPSGVGTLSQATSTTVVYTAPPAPPATDMPVNITATSAANTAVSATANVTVPAIQVSVNPNLATVVAGQIQAFAAAVSFDPGNKGVTWNLSPASGAGTLSNVTSTSATYNAPASAPASDVTVTLTATVIDDGTKTAVANITVPAITVSISPPSATVGANTTQDFTATVSNDPKNGGVTWSLSPASGQGSLSKATSTSVTYNAPANAPASDVTVTLTATAVDDGTKTAVVNVTVPAITVSISPLSVNVEANTTQDFTATANNDPKNGGVTWSLSPASGQGSLSKVTNTSVTYSAPPDAPASTLTLSLTATSVTDPTKSSTANIAVPAISVGVDPVSVLMPLKATQQFTGTVHFDPTGKGVNWSAVQNGADCGSACGTFSPTSTDSGAATTYTAPAALPPTTGVAITATSITDATKSGAAQITLTNGTVKLVPKSLNFGYIKQNGRKSLTLTLTNTGSGTLTVSGMATTSHFSETNGCGASVAAGASCTVTVTFSPASTGHFAGTLTITDSSADSPQVVALGGTGVSSAHTVPAGAASSAVPVPTGLSAVGTQTVHLVDSSRTDLIAGDGSKRELMVRLWYPASAAVECAPANYTTPAMWIYFQQLAGVTLPEVKTNSCQDANVAAGAHPVVVFEPGYTGTFTDYTFLFEDLASRGYVVVALNHTNEATATEFPDGRFVKSVFGSHLGTQLRADPEAYANSVLVRLADLRFLLTQLEVLNTTVRGPFSGKLDMNRIGLAGHSLGGLTALMGTKMDSRFKVGIVIDGVWAEHQSAITDTPLLMMITGRQQWSVDECNLWASLRGPRLALKLPGIDHLAPSDAIWVIKGWANTGKLGAEKTVTVLRDYVAAFLDENLRGQPRTSLLNQESPDFPDVAVTTRTQALCGAP